MFDKESNPVLASSNSAVYPTFNASSKSLVTNLAHLQLSAQTPAHLPSRSKVLPSKKTCFCFNLISADSPIK
jgi:hypothetical protein